MEKRSDKKYSAATSQQKTYTGIKTLTAVLICIKVNTSIDEVLGNISQSSREILYERRHDTGLSLIETKDKVTTTAVLK